MNVVIKKLLGFAKIILYDNGILHVHFLGKKNIDILQAKEVSEFRESLFVTSRALVLTTCEDRFIIPTQEVMEFINSENRALTVKGDAFVIRSLSQRLFIKTAVGLKNRKTPISFFATKENAIEWLLSKKD